MSAAEYWLLEELIYIECIPLVQECTHCQIKSYKITFNDCFEKQFNLVINVCLILNTRNWGNKCDVMVYIVFHGSLIYTLLVINVCLILNTRNWGNKCDVMVYIVFHGSLIYTLLNKMSRISE